MITCNPEDCAQVVQSSRICGLRSKHCSLSRQMTGAGGTWSGMPGRLEIGKCAEDKLLLYDVNVSV